MEGIEKLLKTSFAGAANQLTQLYVTSLQQQKQSYLAGHTAAIESVLDFVQSSSSPVIRVDILVEFLRKEMQKAHVPTPNSPPSNNANLSTNNNTNNTSFNTNTHTTTNFNTHTQNTNTHASANSTTHNSFKTTDSLLHNNPFGNFNSHQLSNYTPKTHFGGNQHAFNFSPPANETIFNRTEYRNHASFTFNLDNNIQSPESHQNQQNQNQQNNQQIQPQQNITQQNNNQQNNNQQNNSQQNNNQHNNNQQNNNHQNNNQQNNNQQNIQLTNKKRNIMEFSVPSTPPSELWDQLLKKVKIDL